MKRNLIFLALIVTVPLIGMVPLGMLSNWLFGGPLDEDIGSQFHYLVGLVAGAWIWGKVV